MPLLFKLETTCASLSIHALQKRNNKWEDMHLCAWQSVSVSVCVCVCVCMHVGNLQLPRYSTDPGRTSLSLSHPLSASQPLPIEHTHYPPLSASVFSPTCKAPWPTTTTCLRDFFTSNLGLSIDREEKRWHGIQNTSTADIVSLIILSRRLIADQLSRKYGTKYFRCLSCIFVCAEFHMLTFNFLFSSSLKSVLWLSF